MLNKLSLYKRKTNYKMHTLSLEYSNKLKSVDGILALDNATADLKKKKNQLYVVQFLKLFCFVNKYFES